MRLRQTFGRAAVLALAAALPGLAWAEGNRLALACETLLPEAAPTGETAPEATEPAAEPAAPALPPAPLAPGFAFAPIKLDRQGAGPVEVTGPTGAVTPGVTASFQGPYAWTEGAVLNTLTVKGTAADGRALVLWQRLDQAQEAVPPAGELIKLLCEVS